MTYLKDTPIEWHPINLPEKWVPGQVVADQRTDESPVVIRLDGNLQLMAVLPCNVRPVIDLPMLSAVERAEIDREVRDDRTRDAAGMD